MYNWDEKSNFPPEVDCFQDGTVVDFEVLEFDRSTSKSGLPMAVLNLRLTDCTGAELTIKEYLVVDLNSSFSRRRVMSFFQSIGLDCIDWQRVPLSKGTCSLKVEEFNGTARNKVQQFLVADAPITQKHQAAKDMAKDEILF